MNGIVSSSNRIFAPAIVELSKIEGLPPEIFVKNSQAPAWTAEQKKSAYKNLNVLDGNMWKKMADFKNERKNLLAQWSTYTPAPRKPSCLNATINAIILVVKIIFFVPVLAFSSAFYLMCRKSHEKNLDTTPFAGYPVTETDLRNSPRS